MKTFLPFLLLAGCSQPPPVVFTNVAVSLPDAPVALPPGPNVELATAACTACHSADMITNQPRLTRAQWQANVEKMVKVYKANIDPDDVAPVVDYLVATNVRLTPVAARTAR